MVDVTTSKNKTYKMEFAWMTIDRKNCILQWTDPRKLIEIIPEFLDLEWIKMVDTLTGQELYNDNVLSLYFASKKDGLAIIKFE